MSQSSSETEYVPTPSLETRVRAITRIPLIKIAAECHRRKWQFSHDEETRMPAAEARRLVRLAFDTLHRIGDMAHKAAEELRSAPKEQTDGVAQTPAEPMRAALEKCSGALGTMPDRLKIAFTGAWAHLGTLTIGQILDEANRALERSPSDTSTNRAMQQLADQAQELDMGYSSPSTVRPIVSDEGGKAVGVPAQMQGSNDCGLAHDDVKPEDTTRGDRPARPVTCPSPDSSQEPKSAPWPQDAIDQEMIEQTSDDWSVSSPDRSDQ